MAPQQAGSFPTSDGLLWQERRWVAEASPGHGRFGRSANPEAWRRYRLHRRSGCRRLREVTADCPPVLWSRTESCFPHCVFSGRGCAGRKDLPCGKPGGQAGQFALHNRRRNARGAKVGGWLDGTMGSLPLLREAEARSAGPLRCLHLRRRPLDVAAQPMRTDLEMTRSGRSKPDGRSPSGGLPSSAGFQENRARGSCGRYGNPERCRPDEQGTSDKAGSRLERHAGQARRGPQHGLPPRVRATGRGHGGATCIIALALLKLHPWVLQLSHDHPDCPAWPMERHPAFRLRPRRLGTAAGARGGANPDSRQRTRFAGLVPGARQPGCSRSRQRQERFPP